MIYIYRVELDLEMETTATPKITQWLGDAGIVYNYACNSTET